MVWPLPGSFAVALVTGLGVSVWVGAAAAEDGSSPLSELQVVTIAPLLPVPLLCQFDSYRTVGDNNPLTWSTTQLQVDGGIQWVDNGGSPHTATGLLGPESFDTGMIAPGSSSPIVQFAVPGTYGYGCVFHPDIRGTIVVA